MREEVINKISIPQYVYNIVVPNMQEYYDGDYPVDFENSRYMKCCFHDEDTPSWRYYEETNTYYCFGCGAGGLGEAGTVIGLHRNFVKKLQGKMPTREEAIKFLYEYFLNGTDSSEVFRDTRVEKKINSESELAQINIYRYNIERAVNVDSTIVLDKKKEFWRLLDEVDMLLSKELVSAEEAEKAIKDMVKKMV